MEIEEFNERNIVVFWLTRAEREDNAFRESLKPLYRQYKDKRYTVAVFLSGENSLQSRTSDLLCHNRIRIAELER